MCLGILTGSNNTGGAAHWRTMAHTPMLLLMLRGQDVPGRQPNMASPLLAASDITDGNRPLFREGAEKHLKQVMVRRLLVAHIVCSTRRVAMQHPCCARVATAGL